MQIKPGKSNTREREKERSNAQRTLRLVCQTLLNCSVNSFLYWSSKTTKWALSQHCKPDNLLIHLDQMNWHWWHLYHEYWLRCQFRCPTNQASKHCQTFYLLMLKNVLWLGSKGACLTSATISVKNLPTSKLELVLILLVKCNTMGDETLLQGWLWWRWWSSGQRACLLIWGWNFQSCWRQQFLFCKINLNEKAAGMAHFYKGCRQWI